MTLAFVSVGDAADPATWSGIPFHTARSLRRAGADLALVSPLRTRPGTRALAGTVLNRLRRRRVFHAERDPVVARRYSAEAARRIRALDAGAAISTSSIPLAGADLDIPVAVWTDATFAGLLNFYPEYTSISSRSVRDGHALERRALARADVLVYSSSWAARSAVEDYDAPADRVHVVPYGANLEAPTREAVDAAIEARSAEHLTAVLIAADWERKRGDFAVATVQRLNALGKPTRLHVVGPGPPHRERLPEVVDVGGWLRKTGGQPGDPLAEVLLRAHVLLLPSLADCTPVAVSEAAACGVPVIATDSGGVGEVVVDGVNGSALPSDATPDDHAREVLRLCA
ncbi:MAG: glycosyltransferase family 4 protein, partial [Miltoncostaeaceae bacterium]